MSTLYFCRKLCGDWVMCELAAWGVLYPNGKGGKSAEHTLVEPAEGT